MKINSGDFRVREGDKVDLRKWPTSVEPVCNSKKHYKELLEEHVEKLSALQQLHYASNHYAVLLIFQAMDAAGKDGAIRHVMSRLFNAQYMTRMARIALMPPKAMRCRPSETL